MRKEGECVFVIKILLILFIVILALCLWKTGELFNHFPDNVKGKAVLAWDFVVLLLALVALVVVLTVI